MEQDLAGGVGYYSLNLKWSLAEFPMFWGLLQFRDSFLEGTSSPNQGVEAHEATGFQPA